MSLDTYTNLQAAVAAWLPDASLTSRIPDFIQLAETDCNTQLRTRYQEARAQLNITGEYVTLPNDFREFRSGYLNSSPRRQFEFMPNDQQTALIVNNTVWGDCQKVYFSIQGDSFRFAPVPTGGETAQIQYWAKIPPLAQNATNWLLTNFPNVYLFGALYYATIGRRDDASIAGAKALFDDELGKTMLEAKRARWGGNNMTMRAA